MTKGKKWVVGALVLAPIIIAGISLSAIYASLPTFQQKVEGEADLPLLLEPEDFGKGPAQGEILLREDGVAVLTGFPTGEIESDGQLCTVWDGVSTFSGAARWTVDHNYMFSISTTKGDVALGPYAPAFGERAWYRFGLPLCGEQETIWYWRDAG